MSDEPTQVCDECGAVIYNEQLDAGKAGRWSGKLLCRHCLDDKRTAAGGGASGGSVAGVVAATAEAAAGKSGAGMVGSVQAFGATGGIVRDRAASGYTQFRRPILKESSHATRCRSFHCKLSDAAITHLNDQVNEWVDHHEDVEIKFAVSTVGVMEGKHADPHLIVTIFY